MKQIELTKGNVDYRIKMEGRVKMQNMSSRTESFVLSLKSNLSFRVRT